MSVIVNPLHGRAERRSEWESISQPQEINDQSQIPQQNSRAEIGNDQSAVEIRVSETEHRLLLHLRMLERGRYDIEVFKDASSMWGLREFRVIE